MGMNIIQNYNNTTHIYNDRQSYLQSLNNNQTQYSSNTLTSQENEKHHNDNKFVKYMHSQNVSKHSYKRQKTLEDEKAPGVWAKGAK